MSTMPLTLLSVISLGFALLLARTLYLGVRLPQPPRWTSDTVCLVGSAFVVGGFTAGAGLLLFVVGAWPASAPEPAELTLAAGALVAFALVDWTLRALLRRLGAGDGSVPLRDLPRMDGSPLATPNGRPTRRGA